MSENNLLKKFYHLYDDKEDWAGARKILFELKKVYKNDHWILSRISSTYYEDKKYKKALEYALKAKKLEPNCPLVLWDLAGALDMLEKELEAIKIWKSLLRKDINKLAHGPCGEGIRSAKSLKNDCRLNIGRSYEDIGRKKLALKYYQLHLDHRQQGIPCLESIKYVKNRMKQLKAS